ncbi:Lcl C-terminal domain-containing protein [Desulfotignum phosphitoxidans]|uniref:Lcl C-terminal domain-containing protein n=1 Tax=Desulfotignum phosphitoxidans DSM 13687 TaxID=1286635 RepID=S0FUM0_9BACT|nr:DUF1566 domain-containing protein [Desulfotignum phosphitoxidans]EMS78410.1 hypothetical protein Dpo_8c00770 [Desulfotignum phosphitoxidans DSM 13687]
MIQPRNVLIQRIIMAISLLVFIGFIVPAMALPPAMEADKLLLSAEDKLNKGDYKAAGQDLKKITVLKIKLPVDYYYQYGRYLAATRQAVEAKRNLETYLDKAGEKGQFYSAALKVYSEVEANEKRWAKEIEAEKRRIEAAKRRLARYKNNNDGTVTDIKTGLMWASKDNGSNIYWDNACAYCQNYSGAGHTDWRMPSQDELAALFDEKEPYHITPLIKLTGRELWGSETRDSKEAARFNFNRGTRCWANKYYRLQARVLPVRTGK